MESVSVLIYDETAVGVGAHVKCRFAQPQASRKNVCAVWSDGTLQWGFDHCYVTLPIPPLVSPSGITCWWSRVAKLLPGRTSAATIDSIQHNIVFTLEKSIRRETPYAISRTGTVVFTESSPNRRFSVREIAPDGCYIWSRDGHAACVRPAFPRSRRFRRK